MASRLIRNPAVLQPLRTGPGHVRPLHASARRLALSEQDTHKDSGERKAEIDGHKDDSLRKQKQGKGHWKGELASNSEAAVKADREEIEASDENIKKMQKETADMAKK